MVGRELADVGYSVLTSFFAFASKQILGTDEGLPAIIVFGRQVDRCLA